MRIFKFIFPFLYVRNWYTGNLEISRPRVILFIAMLSIIILGVLLASILQTPMVYESL